MSPWLSTAVHAGETTRRHLDLSAVDIDTLGRVNENYYRGEEPDDRDYADLAALGIKTVIDLQADGDNRDEARLVEAAGMTFFRIPMTTHVPPTREQRGNLDKPCG